ncbi:MAG: polysaccharide deacetylase family protein [bacterium]
MLYCENHPDVKAVTRCNWCWRSLCQVCFFVNNTKHTFCSKNCYHRFLLARFKSQVIYSWKKISISPLMYYKRGSSILLEKKKIKYACLLLTSFFLLSIFFSIYSSFFNHKVFPPKVDSNKKLSVVISENLVPVNNMTTQLSFTEKITDVDNNLLLITLKGIMNKELQAYSKSFLSGNLERLFSQDNVMNKVDSFSKRINIRGSIEDEGVVELYINDELKDVTVTSNREYFFLNMPLPELSNRVETRFLDRNGVAYLSKCIEVMVKESFPTIIESDLVESRGERLITELSKSVTRVKTKEKSLALTFDAGSKAGTAPAILSILREKGIRCTIFITGEFIENNPDLVKQMVLEGHEIGNHTNTHPHLTFYSKYYTQATLPHVNKEFLNVELGSVAKKFFEVTNKKIAPFWRAPYGEHNQEIRQWAAELGYQHISWTSGKSLEEGLDSLDWVIDENSNIYFSSEEIKNKIVNFGSNSNNGASGGIILMHLNAGRSTDNVYKRLPEIIEGVSQRGYSFVKVSALLDVDEMVKR